MLNFCSVAENVPVTKFQQLKEKVLTCEYLILLQSDTFYTVFAAQRKKCQGFFFFLLLSEAGS